MKAIITGTPVEIEGEPAEIAQLVELLSTGAVMVEHRHRWRIGDEADGVSKAACWCGQERTFQPYADEERGAWSKSNSALFAKDPEPVKGENVVALSGGKKATRTCKVCGGLGHDRRKCPQAA